MLNIGRLGPDGEAYYLDTVASGVEDYYTGAGEAPGYWLSESATGLGLSGRVAAADLRAVLGARHPGTAEALPRTTRRRVPGFDLAFRAPKSVALVWALGDEATAAVVRDAHDQAVAAAVGYLEAHAAYSRRGRNGIERVPIAGFLAAAFRHRTSRAGDPLLHTHVLVSNLGLCPDGQWRTLDSPRLYTHAKTAGYLYQAALREQLTRRLGVAWTDVRNGTAEIAGVSREVIDAFSQRRAQILGAMAECGARSAKGAQAATLDTRQAKDRSASGALRDQWAARAATLGFGAAEVAALLGVHRVAAASDLTTIAAELAGQRGLTARASTFTHRDVVRAWCERLPDGADVTEILRLADATLDARAGLAIALLDPVDAVEQALGAAEGDGRVEAVVAALAGRLEDVAAQELRRSTGLRDSVATLLLAGWEPAQLVAALLARELDSAEAPDAVLAWRAERLAGASTTRSRVDRGGVIRRADGRVVRADDGQRRYSTPELLALEQRLVTDAVARRNAGIAVVGTDAVASALARRPSIAGEQADMVRRLTSSGAAVEVVVGKAGAGKTFALDAAREAWQAAGIRVVGVALAARAAAELNTSAGIDSYTIDGLLADLDRAPTGAGLARGSVVVVDEAAMVGTRKLARLLDHATGAAAKVVLVGDHRQLPEIDAGGVFRGLLHRLDPIQLETNRRQRQNWERVALDELRAGDPAAAIAAYDQADGLVLGDTAEGLRERLVDDWWVAYRDGGPATGVMIAARVSDVDDLNDRARARLAADGALTGPALHAAERAYQAGDRIITLNNDRRLGVLNGTPATVIAVDVPARTIAMVTDDDREVLLPPGYLDAGHVTHAYALTGHKAQGLTTDRAWVLGSDELYREWGYVALSRGREANRLYIVAGAAERDGEEHCHTEPGGDRDAITALAAALQRSRAQHLAVDQTAAPPEAATAGVADRARLQRLLAAAPDDPSRKLEWVAEERDAAQDQLAAAERRQHQASEHRQGLSTGQRRRGRRAAVEHAELQVQRASGDVHRWCARLDDISERASTLERDAEERDRWLADHRQAMSEARELLAVDEAAVRRRVQGAEFRPPAYLLTEIGRRPADPAERRAWRTAATQVERYRTAHGIDDPAQALGDPPVQPRQRIAYECARDSIRAMEAARDRVLTHDPTPQLEQDLG